MAYWLIKSEPEAFSWSEQVKNKIEPWTGVRNYQARNNLQAMAIGDKAFFYHSNTGREIVGIVDVVKTAYPDPTDEQRKWLCVDVRALGAMPVPVTLAKIKQNAALENMALLRQSRLSVSAVTPAEWKEILRMGQWPVDKKKQAL